MKASNCVSPKTFTEWVADQVQAGAGLVPFIGSGVSAASGISTGRQFDGYLVWTLYRCVAITSSQSKEQRLDLREQGWPAPATPSEVQIALNWVWDLIRRCDLEILKSLPKKRTPGARPEGTSSKLEAAKLEAAKLEAETRDSLLPSILRDEIEAAVGPENFPELVKAFKQKGSVWTLIEEDPNRSPTSPDSLAMKSVISLHDWQTTLNFLAQLEVSDDTLQATGKPDQAVIDSFNIHITRGRKPNLAHTMLCHLAGRARIRTILTTNFDSLIEDAFAQLGERYEVIPVSKRGGLPDADTVHSQNCIIKLHGGLVETRVDRPTALPVDAAAPAAPEHELDDVELNRQDKRRFFSYVRGCNPGDKAGSGFLPGLLLVCGYSGSDPRCVQMIKYLLDTDKNAEVLWVCYSEADLVNFNRIFAHENYNIVDEEEALSQVPKPRIILTKTYRLDLLLYELYQRLTLSLPRGGFAYQFSANGPPGVSFDRFSDESPSTKEDEELGDKISDVVRGQALEGKIVVVDGPTELTSPLRHAFYKLTTGEPQLQGMWLELEDYTDTLALAHKIFATLAIRIGRFQLDHARFVPELGSDPVVNRSKWLAHLHSLIRAWGFDPKDWLIVLDGRNGPGGCASWQRRYWKTSEYEALAVLLRALREPSSDGSLQGFNILYAPHSKTKAWCDREADKELFLDQIIEGIEGTIPAKDRPPWEAARRKAPELFQRHKLCDEAEPDTICAGYSEPVSASPSGLSGQFEASFQTVVDDWLPDLRGGASKATSIGSRGRFLYAAVHFRQSRHIAALMSEAVYPCPYRLNDAGIDNDQLRREDVRAWQNELNQAHILFRKPGGHAWMHRDARLGILALIENMGPICLPSESSENKTPQFAVQARAETHFWIADWYGRAYRATGHAMPLLESLYHYYQCLNYVRCAVSPSTPKKETAVRYRHRLARRAFYEMLKGLRLGHRSIQFWSQPSEGHGWFSLASPEGAGYQLIAQLDQVFRRLEKERREEGRLHGLEPLPRGEWLDTLRAEFQRLPRMDNRDIPLRAFGVSADLSRGGKNAYRSLFGREGPPMFSRDCATLAQSDFWAALAKSISGGMPCKDGIALARSLVNALKGHDPQEKKAASASADVPFALRNRLRGWRDRCLSPGSRRPAETLNAAQTLFEAGYLHVRRAKLLEHQRVLPLGRGNEERLTEPLAPSLEVARTWVRACALCGQALDLAFDVHPDLLPEDLRLRIRASTVYGLALGRLGRFYEAHRRLNEAHALLSKSEGAVEPLEIGIIELRRTEVHLSEARLLRRLLLLLNGNRSLKSAGAFKKKICERRKSGLAKLDALIAEQWAHRYFAGEANPGPRVWWEENFEGLRRQHFAKLDDAILALESAQHSLSGKTHSSLWWGRLHTLRLAVFAEHWAPSDRSLLPRTLAFRTRRDKLQFLQRVYYNGCAASTGEHYFLLRLAEYAYRASNKLPERDGLKEFQLELVSDVEVVRADLLRPRSAKGETLITSYAAAVNNALKQEGE